MFENWHTCIWKPTISNFKCEGMVFMSCIPVVNSLRSAKKRSLVTWTNLLCSNVKSKIFIHGCQGSGKSQGKIIFSGSGNFEFRQRKWKLWKKSGKIIMVREKSKFYEQDVWGTPVSSYLSAVILFKIWACITVDLLLTELLMNKDHLHVDL